MKKLITELLFFAIITGFAQPNWHEFTVPGVYDIKFPQQPVPGSNTLTEQGQKLKVMYASDKMGQGATYLQLIATATDLPNRNQLNNAGICGKILTDAMNSTIKQRKGKLLSSAPLAIKQGYGQEFSISANNNATVYKYRLYIVHGCMAMLIAEAAKGNENNFAIEMFFNSFDVM